MWEKLSELLEREKAGEDFKISCEFDLELELSACETKLANLKELVQNLTGDVESVPDPIRATRNHVVGRPWYHLNSAKGDNRAWRKKLILRAGDIRRFVDSKVEVSSEILRRIPRISEIVSASASVVGRDLGDSSRAGADGHGVAVGEQACDTERGVMNRVHRLVLNEGRNLTLTSGPSRLSRNMHLPSAMSHVGGPALELNGMGQNIAQRSKRAEVNNSIGVYSLILPGVTVPCDREMARNQERSGEVVDFRSYQDRTDSLFAGSRGGNGQPVESHRGTIGVNLPVPEIPLSVHEKLRSAREELRGIGVFLRNPGARGRETRFFQEPVSDFYRAGGRGDERDDRYGYRGDDFNENGRAYPRSAYVLLFKWDLNFSGHRVLRANELIERVEELSEARGASHGELFQGALELSREALVWFRNNKVYLRN